MNKKRDPMKYFIGLAALALGVFLGAFIPDDYNPSKLLDKGKK